MFRANSSFAREPSTFSFAAPQPPQPLHNQAASAATGGEVSSSALSSLSFPHEATAIKIVRTSAYAVGVVAGGVGISTFFTDIPTAASSTGAAVDFTTTLPAAAVADLIASGNVKFTLETSMLLCGSGNTSSGAFVSLDCVAIGNRSTILGAAGTTSGSVVIFAIKVEESIVPTVVTTLHLAKLTSGSVTSYDSVISVSFGFDATHHVEFLSVATKRHLAVFDALALEDRVLFRAQTPVAALTPALLFSTNLTVRCRDIVRVLVPNAVDNGNSSSSRAPSEVDLHRERGGEGEENGGAGERGRGTCVGFAVLEDATVWLLTKTTHESGEFHFFAATVSSSNAPLGDFKKENAFVNDADAMLVPDTGSAAATRRSVRVDVVLAGTEVLRSNHATSSHLLSPNRQPQQRSPPTSAAWWGVVRDVAKPAPSLKLTAAGISSAPFAAALPSNRRGISHVRVTPDGCVILVANCEVFVLLGGSSAGEGGAPPVAAISSSMVAVRHTFSADSVVNDVAVLSSNVASSSVVPPLSRTPSGGNIAAGGASQVRAVVAVALGRTVSFIVC